MTASNPESERSVDGKSFPFEAVAETKATRGDRWAAAFDEYVLTPGRILLSDWRAVVGLIIIGFFIFVGTGLVHLVPVPTTTTGQQYIQPFENSEYLLGTNNQAEGILKLMVHGTPDMLQMMFAGAGFSLSFGAIYGVFSGFKGGFTDRIMMGFADILITVPALPLLIVLTAAVNPKSPIVIGILLSVQGWAGLARKLRSQVLTIREESYVEASRSMGLTTRSIMEKDIFPELAPLLLMNFVARARGIIFSSIALFFLGVLQYQGSNWGIVLNEAYAKVFEGSYLPRASHWFLVPLLVIGLFSGGLVLFGQGCDRIFNPRIRARHSKTVVTDDEEKGGGSEKAVKTTIDEIEEYEVN